MIPSGYNEENIAAAGEPASAELNAPTTLEGLPIRGHDAHQQNVGMSTKAPAYGWVIRVYWVDRTVTGLYLGDSDGSAPFVGGLIEGN